MAKQHSKGVSNQATDEQEQNRQAGAELGQAQDKLKVKVDVGVEVQVKVRAEVEVKVNHYKPWWVLYFTKVILNSILIKDVVEVRAEL